MNESAMTVKEWEWLSILAEREMRKSKRAGLAGDAAIYATLADKCQARADALREGRVMP